MRPFTHDLRMHAEAALTLIAQARAAAGPNWTAVPATSPGSTLYDAAKYGAASSALREPDAVDAMELGARKMDFIGLKFQLADEMAAGYARALADSASTDRKVRAQVDSELSNLSGINGRLQDIRNGYTLLRDLYESHGCALTGLTGCAMCWRSMTTPRKSGSRASTKSAAPSANGARPQPFRPPKNWDSTIPGSSFIPIGPPGDARHRAMNPTVLTARHLIAADKMLDYPRIAIDADGMIASIELGEPTSDDTTLTPAFFDIHIHGAAGHDVMEGALGAFAHIGRFLATKGVAHYLPPR